MPKVRTRRLLGLLVLAVVVPLLLLEVGLQISAWIVWQRNHPRDSSAPEVRDEKVVLCVGDSFTFGLGASTPAAAYPSQLEKMLRAVGDSRWKTVNRGWPGHNSRDVLTKLDQELQACRPAVVCVLVGTNDSWSRPALVDGEPSGGTEPSGEEKTESFPWRWRTGRGVAILVDRLANALHGSARASNDT